MIRVNCLTRSRTPSMSSVRVRSCLNSGIAFSGEILRRWVEGLLEARWERRRSSTLRPDRGLSYSRLRLRPFTFGGTFFTEAVSTRACKADLVWVEDRSSAGGFEYFVRIGAGGPIGDLGSTARERIGESSRWRRGEKVSSGFMYSVGLLERELVCIWNENCMYYPSSSFAKVDRSMESTYSLIA